jgi:hypothetical protein
LKLIALLLFLLPAMAQDKTKIQDKYNIDWIYDTSLAIYDYDLYDSNNHWLLAITVPPLSRRATSKDPSIQADGNLGNHPLPTRWWDSLFTAQATWKFNVEGQTIKLTGAQVIEAIQKYYLAQGSKQ